MPSALATAAVTFWPPLGSDRTRRGDPCAEMTTVVIVAPMSTNAAVDWASSPRASARCRANALRSTMRGRSPAPSTAITFALTVSRCAATSIPLTVRP